MLLRLLLTVAALERVGLGEAESEGVTELEGVPVGEGHWEALGLCVALADTVVLAEAAGERESLGEREVEGEPEAEGDTVGARVGLADSEGEGVEERVPLPKLKVRGAVTVRRALGLALVLVVTEGLPEVRGEVEALEHRLGVGVREALEVTLAQLLSLALRLPVPLPVRVPGLETVLVGVPLLEALSGLLAEAETAGEAELEPLKEAEPVELCVGEGVAPPLAVRLRRALAVPLPQLTLAAGETLAIKEALALAEADAVDWPEVEGERVTLRLAVEEVEVEGEALAEGQRESAEEREDVTEGEEVLEAQLLALGQ